MPVVVLKQVLTCEQKELSLTLVDRLIKWKPPPSAVVLTGFDFLQ